MVPSLKGTLLSQHLDRERQMLPHQLLAIILYSSWHYGRIFHENQNDNMDENKAITRILFILLMSYCLYAWTTFFFAFTASKFIFDAYQIIIRLISGPVADRYRWEMRDSAAGVICGLIYIIG